MLPTGFLTSRCRIAPYLREGLGEPIFGEEETRLCRYEPCPGVRSVAVNLAGTIENVPVRGTLFVNGPDIPVGSRVLVGADPRPLRVLAVLVCFGFTQSHLEADVG